MRVLVVGAGALGGLVGALLAESGEDVALLEINLARAKLLNDSGLFIAETGKDERCVPVRVVTSIAGMTPVDLVIVSVKSYQTDAAIRGVLPVIGPDTLVLSMQNGLGNPEIIAGIVGAEHVVSSIIYHSSQHVGPNRLRYRTGIKPIQMAPLTGTITPGIEQIAERFNRANLAIEVVPSIDTAVWQKLLHNATINPVSALTGLTCRELLDDGDLQVFMRDLCMEIVGVMRARGIPIHDDEDPYRPLVASQKALGKNRPSMWQDLARGVRTEIDAINGAIVAEARRLGLSAPHNEALVCFIHSREQHKILRKQETARKSRESTRRTAPVVRSTGVDADGGMPEGRIPLKCAPKLKELIRGYYREVEAAEANGMRVAGISGTGPVELVRAHGFQLYFPENHAALIGATRTASRYITRALAEGFSPFASSAMTADIGAMLAIESPLIQAHGIAGPPRPSVLIYDTNFGNHLARWFEFYGDHFGVPVFGLHPPTGITEVGRIDIDAGVNQLLRVSRHLEAITGAPLDLDRLALTVDLSAQAAALWRQVLNLARAVPSPWTFFDTVVHMAPMVLMRGTQAAVDYYAMLKAELEDRVEQKQAAVPGERLRVFWEGPPIWCALRPLARLFSNHRVAVVGSTYAEMFAFDGLDPHNPIESMARAYTGIFTNRSDTAKEAILAGWFESLGVDAAVYHDDRTNPELSNVRYGLARRMQARTGLPALVVEADSHDPRLFSEDQIRQQLADWIERENGRMSPPAQERHSQPVEPMP